MLSAFWKWFLALFDFGYSSPPDAPAPAPELSREVFDALERERQQRIIKSLRDYFNQRPRPWRKHA